jgi:hypothetical protein
MAGAISNIKNRSREGSQDSTDGPRKSYGNPVSHNCSPLSRDVSKYANSHGLNISTGHSVGRGSVISGGQGLGKENSPKKVVQLAPNGNTGSVLQKKNNGSGSGPSRGEGRPYSYTPSGGLNMFMEMQQKINQNPFYAPRNTESSISDMCVDENVGSRQLPYTQTLNLNNESLGLKTPGSEFRTQQFTKSPMNFISTHDSRSKTPVRTYQKNSDHVTSITSVNTPINPSKVSTFIIDMKCKTPVPHSGSKMISNIIDRQ